MFTSPARGVGANNGGRKSRAGTPSARNSPRPSNVDATLNPDLSPARSNLNPTPRKRNAGASSVSARRSYAPAPVPAATTPLDPALSASAAAAAQQYEAIDSNSVIGSVTSQTNNMTIGGVNQLNQGTLLSKDDVLTVRAFTKMPVEVVKAMNRVDLYIDPVFGEMDVQTGFAYVCTRSACYVWSFVSRGFSSPTCYTFPFPTSSSSFDAGLLSSRSARNSLTLPICSLVPRNGKEPGLLVVLPQGEIRLWETLASSIGMSSDGNGNEDNFSFQRLALPLGAGEGIAALVRCEAKTYALSTTHSRLFRISLHSSGGRVQLSSSPFTQPRGFISRFFGSSPVPSSLPSLMSTSSFSREGLFSLSIGASDESTGWRDLVAISQSSIQLWRLKEGGSSTHEGEKLVCEMDVRNMIENHPELNLNNSSDEDQQANVGGDGLFGNRISLEDSQLFKDGSTSVLFSFDDKGKRDSRGYGIAILGVTENATSFVVRSVKRLRYTAPRDPRPYSSPRLCLPHGGPAAFVAFPDAIVSVILDRDGDFEDFISLKASSANRFLGAGFEATETYTEGTVSNLSVLTLRSGSLILDFNWSRGNQISSSELSNSEKRTIQNDRLRNKLDQAITYGQNPWNPLAFELESSLKGELQIAAEELSHQIVVSASEGLEEITDLRIQIPERLERLKRLMVFLKENRVVGQLSQSSRRQLRSDAEQVAAANELWHYQNEYINSHPKSSVSPLVAAIERVMSEIGQGFGSDVVRGFFKTELPRLGSVLEQLLKRIKSSNGESLDQRSMLAHDVAEIVVTLFQAATKYRREYGSMYSIDGSPSSFEAWTAAPVGLDLLETLFHMTENLIKERSREYGSVIDQVRNDYVDEMEVEDLQTRRQRLQQVLKAQLCSLAEIGLDLYLKRKSYLQAVSISNASISNELSVLDARYSRARPAMIHPLLAIGRHDRAFELAERHRDFRTLVELCHERIGHEQSSINHKIDHFLQRYQKPFAQELYRWYVEKGQLRKLLEQDQLYGDLLLDFLEETNNQRISWIHLLNLGKYDQASEVLEKVSKDEKKLETQKLMLSLSKLGYVANFSEQEVYDTKVQSDLEKRFDDGLDLVQVHSKLKYEFKSAVGEALAGNSDLDVVSQEITDAVASRLNEYEQFQSLFTSLVKRLLRDEVLSIEDLIDLLTLQGPLEDEDSATNFSTAFQVFERAKDVPALRFKDALRTYWRRVLLSSNWRTLTSTASLSDEEISEQLRSTALYRILSTTASDRGEDGGFSFKTELILDAENCLGIPSHDSLKARLKGTPEHKLDLLREEYEREDEEIRELLDEESGVKLNSWWSQVAQLVQRDFEQQLDLDHEEEMDQPEMGEDSVME